MTSDLEPAGWRRDGVGIIDLLHQGVPHVVAAYLLDTDDGLALVETGPASTFERLLAGIAELGRNPNDLRSIVLTHIHLDHSGATGSVLRRFPDVRVYVHEIGAPHLIDPSNLLRSAARIYGDQMGALWGETLPVPANRVTSLSDNDVVTIGGRTFDVLYTPGHASHHVSYFERGTGLAFTGDVAGVRIPPSKHVWPPTPPPDINAELWHQSVARLRQADPSTLLIGHFGVVEREQIGAHLDEVDRQLDQWIGVVDRGLAAGLDRDQLVRELALVAGAELHDESLDELAGSFAMATPFGMSVDGILRYLRKREEQP